MYCWACMQHSGHGSTWSVARNHVMTAARSVQLLHTECINLQAAGPQLPIYLVRNFSAPGGFKPVPN